MTELFGIPANWIFQGGAVGLLALVALMIFTGKLIPISIFRQLEKDRDYWRTAALKSMGQADELLPGARISADVAAALHALQLKVPAAPAPADAAPPSTTEVDRQ